ncbi:MAG: DUF4388 domain-containing protein [Anaerolineales bacterium]|jgi:hypothetical protein|nr:DUF4388 domain-containing protein [Anaerolineales bacterium]MBX3005674.1 DUF4388 domain-containing protein [Anaerolineales bacterium]MCW5838759.1 DUF4388 domain-containing protein [Anaerolineales bacterium]MCW5887500.1 DUF4388 domain-containing protein [Anaerolineales bacterium]
MALKGNLQDFSVTQLLNLINLAGKSGALLVQGPNEGARLFFRAGKLAFAQLTSEGGQRQASLPNILHRAEKINNAQLNTLQARAAAMSDKELGLLLINSGYVTQQDILESLQGYFVHVIQQLFTWVEGRFAFDTEQDVPESKIPVRMALEDIIMEGSRQVGEWEKLSNEIPNLDMALAFTDRPGVNLKKVNLNVEEWRVVSYINPKNSIRQIAKATKMSEVEIRRIVYGLLQAGLIKLIRPAGAATQLDGLQSAFPGKDRQEQKSLVNRLMARIRSI